MEPLVSAQLSTWLQKNSGLDVKRPYLGISGAGKCPRKLYDDFVHGKLLEQAAHRMCYVGYLFERDMLFRLKAIGFISQDDNQREVMCNIDPRIMGHIDGLTANGDLIEIKSLTVSRYQRVVAPMYYVFPEHYAQVQLYMRYGGWKRTWMFYVCRETFEHTVISVDYNEQKALSYENKLLDVLEAIDNSVRPSCTCGYCRDEE